VGLLNHVYAAMTSLSSAFSGHYILQMQQLAGHPELRSPRLQYSRQPPSSMRRPPNFQLAGLAIGDGLTDPLTQVPDGQVHSCLWPLPTLGVHMEP
jgi:hypothetical protein